MLDRSYVLPKNPYTNFYFLNFLFKLEQKICQRKSESAVSKQSHVHAKESNSKLQQIIIKLMEGKIT